LSFREIALNELTQELFLLEHRMILAAEGPFDFMIAAGTGLSSEAAVS